MHLAHGGRGVPVRSQVGGKGGHPGVESRAQMRVAAGEHRHPAGCAQGHLAIGSFKVDALIDEPVEAGGTAGFTPALRTASREEAEAVLVAEEKENVGRISHSCHHREELKN